MNASEVRVTVSGDDNLRSTTGNAFRTRLQERRSSIRSHLSLPLTVHSASWSAASTPSAPTTPTLVHPALILLKVRRGPSVRLSVVDSIERPRGPGAWLAQCVEQFRMSVPMTTPCWSSTSCREGTSRVVAALISMIDFRCSSSPLSANVSSFIRLFFFSFQFIILQRDLLLPRRCSRVQHHHLQHRKSMISATSPTMPPRCQSPLSQG